MGKLEDLSIWRNKSDIMEMFDIAESTYGKRLKTITDLDLIKKVNGETLVHQSIIVEVFSRKRKRKYVPTIEEQKDWEVWSAVHCYYGFESWIDITNKIGEHKPGSISEETIENLIKEFIESIKNSNREVDVKFINDYYNEDSERCDRIIREEYLGNVKYFIKG